MIRLIRTLLLFALIFAPCAFTQNESDMKGSQDHPLFTRMPGYYISDYSVKDFDKYVSPYASGKDQNWEGKMTSLEYYVKTDAKQPSMLQIARNYENAVKKIGGKILANDGRVIEAKIEKSGVTTYAHIEAFNDGRSYTVTIVESGTMKQDVVADAASLRASIAATGRVALYGIYFDTGKSVLKPESGPTLEQITRLVNETPGLALYVVGHTDAVGVPEANVKLSSDRADAVVKALIGRGVPASRLKSAGVGPYCPVGSNHTDEGRASNRRVELVEQN